MTKLERLICFAAVLLAGLLGTPDERATAQPAQWNYTIPGGIATATYPGNVNIQGTCTGCTNAAPGATGVASIAAMQALASPSVNQSISAAGPQGGTFQFTSSPCNNGGVGDLGIQFPGTGGCWVRIFSGAVQAQWFSGADMGAQINNAFLSFGLATAGTCGEVDIPVGKFNFSTRITLPANSGLQSCWLKGQGKGNNGGSVLNWTGTISAAGGGTISLLMPGQTGASPYTSGKFSDFTLVGRNVTSDCADGIWVTNLNGLTIRDIEISNFNGQGSGGCARTSAALLMNNTAANTQNEGFNIDMAATGSGGIAMTGVLLRNDAGNQSFEHGALKLYYIGSGFALDVTNSAYLARGTLAISGDLTNGGTEVGVDATSGLQNENISLTAEVITGTGFLFNVTAGGTCNSISGFFWTDNGNLTTNGTCNFNGDITGAGDWGALSLRTSGNSLFGGSLQPLSSVSVVGGGGAVSFPNTGGTGGALEQVLVSCSSSSNGFIEWVPFANFTSTGTPYGVLTYGVVPTRTYVGTGPTMTISVTGVATWTCTALPHA